MISTPDLQALTRPELDEVYAALGQRVGVYRQQASPAAPGALPPDEYDQDGNPVTPPAPDPTPDDPGHGALLGEYPCVVYQLDAQDRGRLAALGADLAVPLWEAIVHWEAPLHTPGLLLEVHGGELPGPLLLTPLGDVVDEGTQRIAWTLTARAPEGLRGT